MTEILSSYVAGSWHTPAATESARPVRDAGTGELLHSVSSAGIDFTAVADHARTTGIAELQKLTEWRSSPVPASRTGRADSVAPGVCQDPAT